MLLGPGFVEADPTRIGYADLIEIQRLRGPVT